MPPDRTPDGPPARPPSGGTTVALSGVVEVDEDLQEALAKGLQRERMLARPALAGALLAALAVGVAVTLGQGSVPIGVVGALVLLGILTLLLRASTRTRVVRGYAEGSTLGFGLGDGVLRLDTGGLVEVLDLALFSAVTVRGDAVLLRLRRGGTCLLPRVLLGEDDLARIRAGIGRAGAGRAPEASAPATGPLPWSHTVTAADNVARRTRLLGVVRRVRRQTYGLVLVVAVTFCGLTRSPWPLAIVAVIGVQDLLDRRWVARSDDLVYAEGTPVRAGVLDGRLVVATPQALLSRPLDLLLEVSQEYAATEDPGSGPDAGLVVLRWDLPSRETQYPAALLPQEAVDALRAAVPPPVDGPDPGSPSASI